MSTLMDYYQIVFNLAKVAIKNSLTIGRIDNELEPYTDKEIATYIEINSNIIRCTIMKILSDYNANDELIALLNPRLSWISEYLDDRLYYHGPRP
jgi:hypothetical protein